MFLPSSVYSSTSSLNPVPSHSSQSVSTVCVKPRVGDDHTEPAAGRAGAGGVRAEEGGLHAVRLREGGADGVEQAGVGGGAAAARALDRGLVDDDHVVEGGNVAVDERRLARSRDAGDDREDAERDVDVDGLEVVLRRAPDRQLTRWRCAVEAFSRARSSRWRPVIVSEARSPATSPVYRTLAAVPSGARPEVDDVIGDLDHLGLVLDHEHGVALVAQLLQERVHALDVVGVQAGGGLVEDVGDVGEGRADVADHLDALRLTARQACPRRGRARGSRVRCRRTSRRCRAGRP